MYHTKVRSEDRDVREPTEGSRWQLFCDISRVGYPEEILATKWFFNGQEIPDLYHNRGVKHTGKWAKLNSDTHLLNTQLSRNDTGSYTCLMENEIGQGQCAPTVVNVHCKFVFNIKSMLLFTRLHITKLQYPYYIQYPLSSIPQQCYYNVFHCFRSHIKSCDLG